MERKTYTMAPLPFMGQKRRFLKPFKNALSEFSESKIFVDLFGGSGLLSHTTHHLRPDALIIYNDYDNYHKRLEHIPETNRMLKHIRSIVDGFPDDKKLPTEIKMQILEYLKAQEKESGFIDYITLSSSLLFSMKYVLNMGELEKSTMYNCVRKSNYEADGYLDGLTVVRYDYKELFKEFKDKPGVVFIVDPPYLSTEVGTYSNYWRLADYLDVLKVLKENSYFYFTSDKSSIIELCDWLEQNLEATNPFKDATKHEMRVHVNYNAGYNDIMLFKNVNTTGPLIMSDYEQNVT